VILALDLGTTTGWALELYGDLWRSGSESFKESQFEGGGMRFLRFSRFLIELHKGQHVTECYFEEVRRHKGTAAAQIYGGFLASLTKWCEQNKIPYQGVSVKTIKKHATGNGNAKKPAMIAAAKAHKIDVADDNEADAICLLDYALSELAIDA